MALGPYDVGRMDTWQVWGICSNRQCNVGGFRGERIAIGGGRSLNGARMAGPYSQLDRKCQFMECFGMLFICEGQFRVNDVARQVREHNKHGERNAERR